jgi:TPP-dependent pyruvate/acetoin dehydrogenase alpha subunit
VGETIILWVRYNVPDMDKNAKLYTTMVLIRRFEERLLEEFSAGRISGTTHTCIGQEADAAGIFSVIDPEDVIFSNHRCHGHFLAYGGDPYRLAAEIMGKATGLVGGRGGSQHIHWRNFYSNGVQGGIVPIATGMALAEKTHGSGNIVLVFLGDGTLGEGVLYESLNMSVIWKLPILFILEDNHYAQTTPVEKSIAGSMPARFSAFGMQVWERDTSDVLLIQSAAAEAINAVRSRIFPACLILHTYRFSAHSKGDDPRSPQELANIRKFDPLIIHETHMTNDERKEIGEKVKKIIDDSFSRARADPDPIFH